MRILVYGAGNIGSIYAGLLTEAGEDVSLLARGPRLDRIAEHGLELEDAATGKRTTARPKTVAGLAPDDVYDLVIVTLGKDHVADVLPVLAESRNTPHILFMSNNAAGPGQMVDALGPARVLLGFPGVAGVPRGGAIRYVILSAGEQPTTIGELDGRHSTRLDAISRALRGAGFPVATCPRMDAWLKTHVAEILPTALALYMAAGDPKRLAHDRDALVLMLRAIREGHRVLRALDVPITPRIHSIFRWLPEPILISIMRRKLASGATAIKIGHANAAHAEMALLAEEFGALVELAAVPTPAMLELAKHLDPAEPELAAVSGG